MHECTHALCIKCVLLENFYSQVKVCRCIWYFGSILLCLLANFVMPFNYRIL